LLVAQGDASCPSNINQKAIGLLIFSIPDPNIRIIPEMATPNRELKFAVAGCPRRCLLPSEHKPKGHRPALLPTPEFIPETGPASGMLSAIGTVHSGKRASITLLSLKIFLA